MIDLQPAKRIQMTATCKDCGEQIPVREYFTDQYGTNYRGLCKKCDIDIRVVTRINGHLYSGLQKMIEQRQNEKQITPQLDRNESHSGLPTESQTSTKSSGQVVCFGNTR